MVRTAALRYLLCYERRVLATTTARPCDLAATLRATFGLVRVA
jgi:hypothetical protein